MKILNIDPTEKSPEVYLDTDGTLNISGRSIMEFPEKFYEGIMDATKHLDSNSITVTFKYEFFNTASARSIMKLLHFFTKFESTIVIWMTEEGDDDMLEAGYDYEQIMSKDDNVKFKFEKYDEGA